MTSVFHPGELAAQRKAGLREQAERVGAIVRTVMPTAAAEFLANQRMLVVGGLDAEGRMWSSPLVGPPGFLHPERDAVDIAAVPSPSDPLAEALRHPTRVGTIALESGTRRRMRINGLALPVPGGLRLVIEQVYGNCPRYIQRRSPSPASADPATVVSDTFGAEERAMVARADTFFVSTVSAEGDADTSHRGGNPGFVEVDGDRLSWPDYPGNALMMTLGNLEEDPAAGLLFPDWSTGATLQLSGNARVDWSDPERRVLFDVVRSVRTANAIPLRWTDPEYSPHNPQARSETKRDGGAGR